MPYGGIVLNFSCLKCKNDSYEVKTTFMPEKDKGFKLEMGAYYLKTCLNCGYTEMYSAKILDKDEELKPQY